jgi:hypothetical protein
VKYKIQLFVQINQSKEIVSETFTFFSSRNHQIIFFISEKLSGETVSALSNETGAYMLYDDEP